MKKLVLPLVVMLLCSGVSYGVIAGNNTLLYWRDSFGAPNDSYLEAAPGDTVFVALWVNNNDWSSTKNPLMQAWWDGSVVDGLNVVGEPLPYAHLKDYRSGSGSMPSDSNPDPDQLDLLFAGASNLYIYVLGVDTGGAPLATTFDYVGTYGADPGGRLLGFYIPIKASAPTGSSIFSVRVEAAGAWSWGALVWEEELSDTTNTDWALEINVVPEPATVGLLAIGGVAALLRRRK